MPLTSVKLATELIALPLVQTEAEAIQNFATAFENYFYDSTVLAVPAVPGTLAAATIALKAAMVGMSQAGSAAIQAGITAFWGVVATSGVLIWPTVVPPIVSVAPPPGLGGISAALDGVFPANVSAKADLVTAMTNIANALHPTQLGGIATLTSPPGGTGPVL
jgi:cytochrome bd-type quinol oxidase subunit 2